MAISKAELKLYKAKESSDVSTNGGRMSATEVVSGLASNLFPRTTNAERTAGATKYRKCFYKAAAADDSALVNTRVYMENYTPGDDYIVLFLGTQTDTQASITGSERKYGCGQLDVTVSGGATSIDVATEAQSEAMFQNGDYIRVSDKDNPDAVGNEEIVQINATVTYTGDVAHISFTPALSAGYSSTNTRVASLLDIDAATGDVQASYSGFNVTTAGSGDYDDVTSPLVMDSIGCVYQVWTLSFTSSTAFDVIGDELGNVGSGNITGGATPNNPSFSQPYFTLPSAGFSGSWVAGDTITFTTSPASVPIWLKRVVPAGAASISSNKAVLAIDGESA